MDKLTARRTNSVYYCSTTWIIVAKSLSHFFGEFVAVIELFVQQEINILS